MKKLNYCFKCGHELGKVFHEGRERFHCDCCDEIRFRNSIPVAGVFVVRDEEVLLIKRRNEPNKEKWSYPAGYLEFDERPELGAVRELEEETGLSVDPDSMVLVTTIQIEHPDRYVVGNAYKVKHEDTKGEIKAGSDALKARFWSIKDMRERTEELESDKITDAAEKAVSILHQTS